MLFSHDTERTLRRIVDLVNSAPSAGGPDQLTDLAALCSFVARHQVSDVGSDGATAGGDRPGTT